MATRNVDLHRLSLLPRGTLTFQREGDPGPLKWVYQRVGKNFGNVPTRKKYDLQLRRHVVPLDPKTPAQLTQRGRMAAAVADWRLLTAADRTAYNRRASRSYRMTGFNLYIREHIKKSLLGY